MKTGAALARGSRRSFVRGIFATGWALTAAGRLFAEPARRTYDLVVAGGTVIDPYRQTKGVADVGIQDGKIARVADRLPRAEAARVLDATGLMVSPGWIDLHAHVFLVPPELRRDPSAAKGGGW